MTQPASPFSATAQALPSIADYAIGEVRDLFLATLEDDDRGRAIAIARHLVGCGNPLPSAVCVLLGLPPGSSYGAGARAVLAEAATSL